MKMKPIRTDTVSSDAEEQQRCDAWKEEKNRHLQMLSLLVWCLARTGLICIRQFL